jgi:hypothetical protein
MQKKQTHWKRKREGKGKEGKQQAFWASWRNRKKKPTTKISMISRLTDECE